MCIKKCRYIYFGYLIREIYILSCRFPIPDLRQDPHVDKSWWQRNLREEVLSLDCDDVRLHTTFNTSQSVEQFEVTCSEIHGRLQKLIKVVIITDLGQRQKSA